MDSMCLFDIFYKLSINYGFTLMGLHVHHGIRGKEADRDLDFVGEYCKSFGIDLIKSKVDAKKYAKEKMFTLEEAARILGEQDENASNAAETEVNYEIGDKVKITDGPFSGFSGTVDEIIEDRSKLKVIVVIFGRKTLLELSFTQVTKE